MKHFLCLLLALIMFVSAPAVASAEILSAPDGSDIEIVAVQSGDSTRAEETLWYFRVVNGILQMRLWSLTYGKWLTDWIDVGPYVGG